MKVRVSRVALIAALTWTGFSTANACPTEQHSFRSSDDEISWIASASAAAGFASASLTFSHDVEDESVSSHIRQIAAAASASDVASYYDSLDEIPSPAALAGLTYISERKFLVSDEDELQLEVAESTGSIAEFAPSVEMALDGYEDQ